LEDLNRRLTYGNGLSADTGGHHLVKLLRLPGTTSYKRPQAPHPVRITHYDLNRIYHCNPDPNAADDFDQLPPLDMLGNAAGSAAYLRSLPDPENLPAPLDLTENKYGLTKQTIELLTTRQADRSKALWQLYHLFANHPAGISPEQAFTTIRNTPNDKFSQEWRYNSDEGLWNDLLRGYHACENPTDGATPTLAQLQRIRTNKQLTTSQRRRAVAHVILTDLQQRGRLYFDPQRQEAMFYDGRSVLIMDPSHRRWKTLLNTQYHVTEGEDEFKPVNATLYAHVSTNGERVIPRVFSYYDWEHNLLYVYNNGGKVFRLDGYEIHVVDNGTDGVLFKDREDNRLIPTDVIDPTTHQPTSIPPETPTLTEAIFSIPNYAAATAEESADLARLWTLSTFFSGFMEARPHLVVTGPTNSGKTMVFQLLQELFVGPETRVDSVPNDKTTFESVVSNTHLVFFDNVDTPNKWFADSIAEAATGIQFTRRVLYTTNESVTYRVQCFLGLTTRDPWFSRTDIATRLVVLQTERRRDTVNPLLLLARVRQNRNALWTQLLRDLNAILLELPRYTEVAATNEAIEHAARSQIRMAAFADFMLSAARATMPEKGEVYARRLINRVKSAQSESALDHSILYQALNHWLQYNSTASGRQIKSSSLHTELRFAAADAGQGALYERLIPNARSLGHQLTELIPDIEAVIDVDVERHPQGARYTFTLRDQTTQEAAD
jgi:hypothetical protein